jgi:glycerate 2-kinase
MYNAKIIIRELFNTVLRAADPAAATAGHVERLRSLYRGKGFSRLLVIGFGKAALPMGRAMEETVGNLIDEGAIITSCGHGAGRGLKMISVHEAGHPLPDENGLKGSGDIIRLAEAADERTLAFVLISGGGSALFVSPCEGITLAEKQEMTSLLLKAGADIREMNMVRKHISRVKGGRLAEILHPATTVSLILSDVIGDPLDVIASGPTSPDPSTYGDALAVIGKYGLVDRAPRAVMKFLADGAKGVQTETPKDGSPVFRKVQNLIIGSNRLALEAAKRNAEELGHKAEILTSEISGEAREVGRWLARRALAEKPHKRNGIPRCLISGGETTVTVTGKGLGGRNMELALAFAMEVEGTPGITLLSAGTDGIDGPTDAAGAVVDGRTVARARGMGLNAEDYLAGNDSYNFFQKAGGLIVTGPTGTNVMDMQIVFLS